MTETKAAAAKRLGVPQKQVIWEPFNNTFMTLADYEEALKRRVAKYQNGHDNLPLLERIRLLGPDDIATAKGALRAILRWAETTDKATAAPEILDILREEFALPSREGCPGTPGGKHHFDTKGRCYNCPVEGPIG